MSNAKNLARDMLWFNPDLANLTWPTTTNRANANVGNTDKAIATCSSSTDASATSQMLGIQITQPEGENTPYRVKIKVATSATIYAVVGYASSSTGTNDTLSSYRRIPLINGELDEVVTLIEKSGSEPAFFGLITDSTSTNVVASISVQRLNVVPPTYAATVS
jgi:hypothetical protein